MSNSLLFPNHKSKVAQANRTIMSMMSGVQKDDLYRRLLAYKRGVPLKEEDNGPRQRRK